MSPITVSELSAQLRSGEISSVELTQDYLQRIERSELNAFISVSADSALAEAQTADAKRAQGDDHPLLGIPVAHKDIFCIEGTLTTCGSKILHNFIAPYTATVIQNMQNQGLVSLGKTNMDEFAMGSSNENSYYGSVTNPWSSAGEQLVPGGSSGGSAAAVAAGLAPAATGTDTGGSIRQPAAFCNLTGLKPSYGRCSRYGMIAFASSLDQAGPLTHTAADAALLLNSMAGFDTRDATSLDTPAEDFTRHLDDSIDGLIIGMPSEFFSSDLDPEVASIVEAAIKSLESLGAIVKQVSLPNSHLALPSYYVIAPAEASSNLSRFDGVRYGHRAEQYTDLVDMYTRTRTEGFGDEVKRRIMIGTYALSSGYYDAYYAQAQKLRRLIADDFNSAFEQCDLIVGPTTPAPAFPHGSKTEDPVAMYLNDIFTIPANLAGLPAASTPAGFTKAGLPVGLHLIGPYLQEAKLLNAVHRYQQETDWHLRSAPGAAATESA
ncbi:MAG: Asp-tRNA(Asn)/Glu-tRNA(Gln) amidotransferase subunit GatA [Gammaproteobacteria bacterium]|nr:Asp-tRNA(Asn)/Glu-tRNA(Gln) amidotransferase subunit GatA [Gammaproteobacteria bacterium]